MIPFSNEKAAAPSWGATEDGENADVQALPVRSEERRRDRLRDWRAENRERLREYGRNWKAAHPDRIKLHREREYAQRRRRRRRLRFRRGAQRRRRALKRSTIRQTTF
jgi:hypothetical protein